MHRVSDFVKAVSEVSIPFGNQSNGIYGRYINVSTKNVNISGDQIDVEFDVPFDDDTEPNEAEITVYNLTESTIHSIKVGEWIVISAGYKGNGNSGIIFKGYVSKITSKLSDVDRVVSIKALDTINLKDRQLCSIAFSQSTPASFIVEALVKKLGVPIGMMKFGQRNACAGEKYIVEGSLLDAINDFAKDCGVVVYPNGGFVYVRPRNVRAGELFEVSAKNGMVGSPEIFEETETYKVNEKEITRTLTGYKIKMLLQHNITVGSGISLRSSIANGEFVVRAGRHYCSGSDFYTEIEVM